MSITSREIIDSFRQRFPLKVTLPAPITGEPFTVDHKNLLALVVSDPGNLGCESQTVAMLFVEMSRLRAAAVRSSDEIDVRFRSWKSQKRMEAKSKAKDGKITDKAQEDFYRTHPD